MANFPNTTAGREAAEALVRTRMIAKTWVVGHMAHDKDGNVIVRYQRFMTAAAPAGEGAWLTSRDDAAT